MKIPLSSPDITDHEREKVLEVLNAPCLSLGPGITEFEEKFASYTGSRYAVALSSGTAGLHLCVKSAGIGDDDGAFTTPFSFIASANCLLFERAKPVFVDIDERTLNIDAEKLSDEIKKRKEEKNIKAIIPVHVFGRPCDMDDIVSVARDHDLDIIEDACEAVGAEYRTELEGQGKWKKTGTFGSCGVFAFYPNKQITTGEGGIIVTDDEDVYRLCRSLRNQGRSEEKKWLQHERLGYNYRISDINCVLGSAQLDRIEEILDKRESVAKSYNKRLGDMDELIIPAFEDNKKISWFVYVVRLTDRFSKEDRDNILSKLSGKGIGCSNYFSPVHLQPYYKKMFGMKKGDFPVTEKVSERTIALPFYNDLSEDEIDYVCGNLKETIGKVRP